MRKFIFLFSFLFFLHSLAFAEGNKTDTQSFWMNFVDGFHYAQQTGKNMFVIVGSQTCSFCKDLKLKSEKTKKIRETIKNFFVPVYIEKEKDFIPVDLLERSDLIPAIFIVSYKNGEIRYGPLYGDQTRTNLLNFLLNSVDLK